jgi:hypothetical protein
MSELTPQQVIVNYFVEEGLIPEDMSYGEIAEVAVGVLAPRLAEVERLRAELAKAAVWEGQAIRTAERAEHDGRMLNALDGENRQLRAELARRDEQIAAVRNLADEWRDFSDTTIYLDDAAADITQALDGLEGVNA